MGGSFEGVGGSQNWSLARLNPDGSVDGSFNFSYNWNNGGTVRCLAVGPNGGVLVGGAFENTMGNQYLNNLSLFNSSDGTLEGERSSDGFLISLCPGADGPVDCLAWFDSPLIGGEFQNLLGYQRNNIGRVTPDASIDFSFAPDANGAVKCVAIQSDGSILLGGEFTILGGQAHNHIGRVHADGSLDTTFMADADQPVYVMAVQADGGILVGGGFSTLDGQVGNHIGRFNQDGTLDTSFTGSADADVYALALQANGRIVVGGAFYTLSGQPSSFIGRLNADGSPDPGFNAAGRGCLFAGPPGKWGNSRGRRFFHAGRRTEGTHRQAIQHRSGSGVALFRRWPSHMAAKRKLP